MPEASAFPSASAYAMDDFLPPPPPPIVLIDPLPLAVDPNNFPPPADSFSSSISLGSTLLIITAVASFSFVACLFIRLGRRLRRSSSSVASASVLTRHDLSTPTPGELTNKKKNKNAAPIDSQLPLFELSSSLSDDSKSSPDCVVCLLPFLPDEDIRRLPACGHAFHAECVDTWIQNSPSCPLCRATVLLPPTPPSRAALPVKMSTTASQGGSSLRDESWSISLPPLLASPPRRLLFSIGSSIDDPMEDDVETAVARIWTQVDYEASASVSRAPSPLRDEIPAATGSGGWRGNLMGSMDRGLSTRSSSFRSAASSFRQSGLSIDHQEDSGGEGGRLFFWNREEEEEDRLSAVYRWIVGA
ncbi:E3 ubiquitin-protein ligase ATL4-like [Zingiber officinale]|nr:E3 ubiquitin-protein ligase ATL4-like [Zingiber officinale]